MFLDIPEPGFVGCWVTPTGQPLRNTLTNDMGSPQPTMPVSQATNATKFNQIAMNEGVQNPTQAFNTPTQPTFNDGMAMNSYDKDMMHERELIYDAKQQEKDHPSSKSNDDKLIYDAKVEIHKEDLKKKGKKYDNV